jgi:hypothetical protein
LLKLCRTPRGMALAQGGDLLFRVVGQPIVRSLRAAWLILQGLVEGGECPTAKFIKITATELSCPQGDTTNHEKGPALVCTPREGIQ